MKNYNYMVKITTESGTTSYENVFELKLYPNNSSAVISNHNTDEVLYVSGIQKLWAGNGVIIHIF